MTPTLSLRLRLTLLWCAVSLVLLLGLELLSLAVLSAQLDGAVDNDLALVAGQYQDRVTGATGLSDLRDRAQAFLADDVDAGHGFAAVYRIQLDDGTVLSNNGDRRVLETMAAAVTEPGVPATVHDTDLGDPRLAAIPVLVVTAGRKMAQELVGPEVLFKPFSLEDLLSKVERLVNPSLEPTLTPGASQS